MAGGTTIFNGRSGGFDVTWTTQDITAGPTQSPSNVVFSARTMAQAEFDESMTPDAGEEPPNCSGRRTFTMLAVVGSTISYLDKDEESCDGGGFRPGDQHHIPYSGPVAG